MSPRLASNLKSFHPYTISARITAVFYQAQLNSKVRYYCYSIRHKPSVACSISTCYNCKEKFWHCREDSDTKAVTKNKKLWSAWMTPCKGVWMQIAFIFILSDSLDFIIKKSKIIMMYFSEYKFLALWIYSFSRQIQSISISLQRDTGLNGMTQS